MWVERETVIIVAKGDIVLLKDGIGEQIIILMYTR